MKKIFAPLARLLVALFVTGAMFMPATTFAEDAGMAAFREILERRA